VSLSVGEVSRRSGIPATTLRYYEAVGLLAPPPRWAGRRQYNEEVLDTLVVIGAARAAGFDLREVRVLLDAVQQDGPGPAWRALAEIKRQELTEQLGRVQAMLGLLDAVSACSCATTAECAQRLRSRTGHKLAGAPPRPAKGPAKAVG
jgi:MerR family redox-sensitive transcriptional activator SoxR